MNLKDFLKQERNLILIASAGIVVAIGALVLMFFFAQGKAQTIAVMLAFFLVSVIISGFHFLKLKSLRNKMEKRDRLLTYIVRHSAESAAGPSSPDVDAFFGLDRQGFPVLEVLKETARYDLIQAYRAYLTKEHAAILISIDPVLGRHARFVISKGEDLKAIEELPTWVDMEREKKEGEQGVKVRVSTVLTSGPDHEQKKDLVPFFIESPQP